jgi:hypothetical protein
VPAPGCEDSLFGRLTRISAVGCVALCAAMLSTAQDTQSDSKPVATKQPASHTSTFFSQEEFQVERYLGALDH